MNGRAVLVQVEAAKLRGQAATLLPRVLIPWALSTATEAARSQLGGEGLGSCLVSCPIQGSASKEVVLVGVVGWW